MSALKSAVRGEVNMRFDFSQLLFLPPAAAGAVSPVTRWENEKFRNPKHFHSHLAPVEAQCSVLLVNKGSTNFCVIIGEGPYQCFAFTNLFT